MTRLTLSRLGAREAVLALCGADLAVVLAASFSPGAPAADRMRAVAFLTFPLLAVAVPAMGAASAAHAALLGGALVALHAVAAALLGMALGVLPALLALGIAFTSLTLSLPKLALRFGRSRGGALALGSLGGFAVLAGPFVANPLLEHPSAAAWRPLLVETLLVVHPFAGLASAMGFDWLRADGMYALSVIGPFYPYRYPSPYSVAALLAGGALLVLALSWLAPRVPPRAQPGPAAPAPALPKNFVAKVFRDQ